jgi:hypothetical protein
LKFFNPVLKIKKGVSIEAPFFMTDLVLWIQLICIFATYLQIKPLSDVVKF